MMGDKIKKNISAIKNFIIRKEKYPILRTLRKEIKFFNTIFDVGAYHGNFTHELLAINPKLKIHCFEPFSYSYQSLSKRFKNNTNVIVNNVAVSSELGYGELNINSYKETNSLLPNVGGLGSIDSLLKRDSNETVKITTLDDYININKIGEIDLLKIDVQGNSYEVLLGFQETLTSKKIKYIYVEVEFIEIYQNEKLFQEIDSLLKKYGYFLLGLYNLNHLDNYYLSWADAFYGLKK